MARDVVARSGECGKGEALLRPVMLGGRLIEPLPSLEEARQRAADSLAQCLRRCGQLEVAEPLARAQPRIARLIEQTRRESAGMKTVFFDIDTQSDFLYPAGALYVPKAERIVPAVARLNRFAAEHGIPVISTVDAHAENDAEFAQWPPHCVAGTLGQRKLEAHAAGAACGGPEP